MKDWGPLAALAMAQFVMVLDQAVMNVSISQLVEDFDTTVSTIQGVITLYSLVMAMFLLVGAKIGDIIGRRRAFIIGLVVYAALRTGLLVAMGIALASLMFTRHLPARRPTDEAAEPTSAAASWPVPVGVG